MKRVLIVHHVDMDGYTSCALLHEFYLRKQYEVNTYTVQYGSGIENAIEYIINTKYEWDNIIIVDLSLTLEQAIILNGDGYILQIDHHPINYKPFKWQHIDTSISATLAVNDYVNGKEFMIDDSFIKAVNAADIFDKSDMKVFTAGRRITYHLNSLNVVYEEGYNTQLTMQIVDAIKTAAFKKAKYNPEAELYLAIDTMSMNIESNAKKAISDGYLEDDVLYVLDIDGNPSDVADYLIENRTIRLLVAGSSEKGTVALRGEGAREIATLLGGGGHPTAAGCKPVDGFEDINHLMNQVGRYM